MFSRRELLLLRAMYQHRTVTAAAASINMTQPAASALLRDMETRMGFQLFSREKRRLQLTSHARTLIPEVLNALSAIESADRLAGDIRQGTMSRLAVGAVAITASSLLPPALLHIRKAYPSMAVTLRAGSALDIIEMAVDQRIDLGVIVGTIADNERVSSVQLAPLSLYAIFRADHPWAERKQISLHDVAMSGPIVLATALPAGRATRQAMEGNGLPYRPMIEVMQSSSACALAAQGLGVGVVESLGARYAQRQGLVARHLVALQDPVLALVWSRDRSLSEPARQLKDVLLTQVDAW